LIAKYLGLPPPQVWFLAHSALRYPPEDVIAAVKKLTLRDNDASALVEFWDLVRFA
jgi:hypothetical protein